jgi:peptide/nickel transport system ATP-binding protein/oligopeptide transport system ATP-binding protein
VRFTIARLVPGRRRSPSPVLALGRGSMTAPLLVVRELVKHFESGGLFGTKKTVYAVNGVSFDVGRGETLGLVGESGSGKTTVGRSILRLLDPTSGAVEFDGTDVLAAKGRELKSLRRRMQIVFQDPYGSLNPRMTIGASVAEGIEIHRLVPKAGIGERVAQLLREVGLDPDLAIRYPHEFSGGQRQRIGIARALAVDPGFLVCDEPVSALDVSVQAQVLNVLLDLQRARGLSYLFIAHDLAVVRQMAGRVAVMYFGRIVEHGSRDQVLERPRHPYTIALLSAVPEPDPETQRIRIVLPGDPPSPSAPPPGCPFASRCWHPEKSDRCTRELPLLRPVDARIVACHYAETTPPTAI